MLPCRITQRPFEVRWSNSVPGTYSLNVPAGQHVRPATTRSEWMLGAVASNCASALLRADSIVAASAAASSSAAAAFLALSSSESKRPSSSATSVLISGFEPRDERYRDICSPQHKITKVRSLHVVGQADEVVDPSRSLQVADLFQDPTIVEHDKGHMVPSDKRVRDALKSFMLADVLH